MNDTARALPTAARFPQAAATTDAWMQRVGQLVRLGPLLAERGVALAPLLSAAGLRPDALDDPERRVPYASVLQLINAAVRASGCPHFGLMIGAAGRLSHMGLLGELLVHGPTVGDGLRGYVVNQRLFSDGMAAFLLEHDATVEFGFAVFHPDVVDLPPLYDLLMAAGAQMLGELSGAPLPLLGVDLPRARPDDVQAYRAHFGCRVAFDAERAALHLPRALLAQPVPRPDAARARHIEATLASAVDDRLLPALYRSLRLLLLHERATAKPLLAQQFLMHERTLQRRLAARNLRFRDVLAQVRRDLACQLLRDTERPVTDIAQALGYGDAAVFHRSFRRWTGTTPARWRSAQRAS